MPAETQRKEEEEEAEHEHEHEHECKDEDEFGHECHDACEEECGLLTRR
jgi:hypothetical protein